MRTMSFTRWRGDDDVGEGAADPDPLEERPRPGVSGGVGRRRVPHLVLGILLVLGGAVGSLAATTQFDGTRPVLVAARPVTVGQTLTALDVREVSIPADADVRAIDAARGPELLGRPVAASLPAGAVFTPESIADAGVPPTGQAIVALALEPGQLPPEVGPGDLVSVVASPDPGGAASRFPISWPAVVSSLLPPETGGITVVSVQLGEAAAEEVAATPAGQLSIVAVGR